MLPGDSNVGHWDTKQFIKSFNPKLTPAESILQAGKLCYSGMASAFKEAGYSKLLMAVGDHELGDNPWPAGTAVSECQPQFREAFAIVFNINPDNGQFFYDKPIGEVPSRPLGTKYETTSFAYQYKNVLFVTVDVFHQEDPNKTIGLTSGWPTRSRLAGWGTAPARHPSANSFMFSMESSHSKVHLTKSPSGHVG